ncbi:hypothetical protein [Streptomyces nanshensis]|uniref:Uncharacterized protein n=1 Tax=Streptomyces nanshensis TaxID=518642 RepID=A0A1E7KZ32_9ACTN|nr:hypothetical protein [Streptomyces nanshensis]OEV09207.1 hypothetical protein AN218_22275 [Streptomyces nanshensis]
MARCPTAHPADASGCTGRPLVTVLDRDNAGADGCEHHAARLLATLAGGRVYGLPHDTDGAAVRVFRAAGRLRPWPWSADARPAAVSVADVART